MDLVVLSVPALDRSIKMHDLRTGRAVSRRYRSRRVGEFLKELDLAEGRSTGITRMLKVTAANRSPAPVYDTDDDRRYFMIRKAVHERAVVSRGSARAVEEVGRKSLQQLLS